MPLKETLLALEAPALLLSVEDSGVWDLEVMNGRREPFRCRYESHILGTTLTAEEDDYERDYDWNISSLHDLLPWLSRSALSNLMEDLKRLSYAEVVQEVCAQQAEAIVKALESFGIPCDKNKVSAVLMGTSVTDGEWFSELGNLPRFLIALGIQGAVVEWFEGQTAHAEEPLAEADEALDTGNLLLEASADFDEQAMDAMEDLIEKFVSGGEPAPGSDTVLYEGAGTRFFQADPEAYGAKAKDLIKALDADMHQLGLHHVGDLVLEMSSSIPIRAYVSTGEAAYWMAGVGPLGPARKEFYTAFDDGSSLTTSTPPCPKDRPERGLFYAAGPRDNLAALYALHQQGITSFRDQGRQPLPASPTLLDIARAMDDLIARQQST